MPTIASLKLTLFISSSSVTYRAAASSIIASTSNYDYYFSYDNKVHYSSRVKKSPIFRRQSIDEKNLSSLSAADGTLVQNLPNSDLNSLSNRNENDNKIAANLIELKDTSKAIINSSNSSSQDKDSKNGKLVPIIIVSLIYVPIILSTLIGNMLVILAVIIVRKLHTQDNANNFLIVSLAVSDFLVGVLVMPLALYVDLSDEHK
jgi:hypothetical protein